VARRNLISLVQKQQKEVMKISERHTYHAGEEMPYSHHLQIISAVVFLLVWSLDSFIFKFSVWLASFVPWVFRLITALCVIILGIILVRLAEKALFHEELESPTVIDTGILGHVQHPLYLGVLIIYLGFIIGTFSIASIVIFIFIALIYNKLATYEEKDLERIFGEKYLEYKNRVPKWIPRLSSAKTK
jgi:protein-S-isoprenylcysteine O-methyltransferase Ste14